MKKLIVILLTCFSINAIAASAIALSKNQNSIGISIGSETVEKAKAEAIKKCLDNSNGVECVIQLSSGRPGWGAVSVGKDGFYIVFSKNKPMEAINNAIENCDKNYIACKLKGIFFDKIGIEELPEIELPLELKKEEQKENKKEEQIKKMPTKKNNEVAI